MAEKIKRAIPLRQSCVNQIHELFLAAQRARTDQKSRILFRVRYSVLESIREEFSKQHNVIVTNLATSEERTDCTAEDLIREGFDNEYFEIQAIYYELFEATPVPIPGTSISASPTPHIQLPRIELIKFSGDIKNFPTFIDLYNALVHNNSALNPIEKFNYLLSALKGPPLSLIQCLPTTADNYAIAYQNLVERYSNKRLRALAHWNELENANNVTSDNPTALRRLLDIYKENLAALGNLKFPIDQWDFILVNMLLKRLDSATVTRFEMEHGSNEIPKYDNLMKFLEKHSIALDTLSFATNKSRRSYVHNVPSISTNRGNSNTNNNYSHRNSLFVRTNNHSPSQNTNPLNCRWCNQDHPLYRCQEFRNKQPAERLEFCKNSRLCFNCLSSMHDIRSCRSEISCRHTGCTKRHHTLLHMDIAGNEPNSINSHVNSSETRAGGSGSNNSQTRSVFFSPSNSAVLLPTANVEVLDSRGCYIQLRAILDTGSQTTFITQKSASNLGLPKENVSFGIQSLNSIQTVAHAGGMTLTIRPVDNNTPTFHIDAVILSNICSKIPSAKINIKNWSHIQELPLADPQFFIPKAVDLLLGADVFPYILENGHIPGKAGQPDALNTIFGYILLGKLNSSFDKSIQSFFCEAQAEAAQKPSLDKVLQKFWEIETVPEVSMSKPEDKLCEQHFLNHVKRDCTGRYTVSLPFRPSLPTFPNIRELALNRFFSLERRLLKQPKLYQEYCEFMREYLFLGHMEKITNTLVTPQMYYIPHHCILKPSSLTTKLRVVFNASAKLPGKSSLNEMLYTGEKLQRDIVTILLNFRLHRYVFIADIRMMYRQIMVSPSDRDYQRIIWRFSPHDPIKDYRLCTLTYGTISAPYIAIRTLLHLAEEEESKFPNAARILRTDTYMDDIITGTSDLNSALELQQELIQMLKQGCFELRKWSSNDTKLLSSFPSSHLSTDPLAFDSDSDDTLKILGLEWSPAIDYFSFKVLPLEKSCTKRTLLGELCRIFDPIGLLSPTTFFCKVLIQRLWILGSDWDQSPPDDILRIWKKYKSELSSLSAIKLPRILTIPEYKKCELHGFCDGSEKGYGAVIYLRFVDPKGRIFVKFVCAKSKIAPITKRVCIPRIELCAAVLLAKLTSFILTIYESKLNISRVCTWSDSQVALAWLNAPAYKWKTFEANRVSYIRDNLPTTSWRYVESKLNPADPASRGLLPSELINCEIWWKGPAFLSNHDDYHQTCPDPDLGTVQSEERRLTLASFSEKTIFDHLLSQFSSFRTLQRVTAYVLRFTNNLKKGHDRRQGALIHVELQAALLMLIKYTQSHAFTEEFSNDLKPIHKPFKKLNAFFYSDGIIRVGGRLQYSLELSYDQKCPILLPKHSPLTQLIITHYHLTYFHAGLRTTHFLISQKFWILSAKTSIRSVLSRCVKCFKARPVPYQPPMGNLPLARISQAKAFLHTAVDYGGPFKITMSRHRGAKTLKAYLCLFICMATKAIHLELSSDLSAATFLAALRRFVSRRGKVSHLYSDQGTNFRGGINELYTFMSAAATQEQIQWHPNCAGAPHMGGLWEAGIKSVKNHLTRVVGEQIFCYEEFYTILVQIEAVLNSRPLVAMSSDPSDFAVLTPGHFLTLEPLTAIPDKDLTLKPINRLSRWELIQKLHQDFWRRWSQEYLHTLHQRHKWHQSLEPIELGTLVLIKDELLPPLQWKLARIVKLHPGKDNVCRVATVQTKTGNFTRPLVKLCPLPVSSETNE